MGKERRGNTEVIRNIIKRTTTKYVGHPKEIKKSKKKKIRRLLIKVYRSEVKVSKKKRIRTS